MQDNENQGRVFFRNAAQRTSAESVANQVISTGNAQINQMQRQNAEKNQRIDDILKNINTVATGAQTIQKKQNARSIQSIESSRELALINANNEFLNIDKMDIPEQEKFAKKEEIFNNFKTEGAQALQGLKENKGLWQKFLGTEEDYNTALQGEVNKQAKLEQAFEATIVQEARKADEAITKQNILKLSQAIDNAGNERNIITARNATIKNIEQARKDGKLTEAEAMGLTNQALSRADDRKVAVLINIAMDEAIVNGNFIKGIDGLENSYNEVMQKEGYNAGRFKNISDRPKSATEIRNAIIQLKNQFATKTVNDISYPITASPNEIELSVKQSEEYKNGDQSIRDSLIKQARKAGELPPAEKLISQNALAKNDYGLRQQEFDKNGLYNETILTKEESKAFAKSANMIGVGDKLSDGKEISFSEQVDQFLDVAKSNYKGLDDEGLKKEILLNLDGVNALAIIAQMEGNPNTTALVGAMIQKNQNGENRPKDLTVDQEKTKKDAFFRTDYGKYLINTDPKLANKFAEAMIDVEIYSNRDSRGSKVKVSKASEIIAPNKVYYLNDTRNGVPTRILELDKTKVENYDQITSNVAYLQRNTEELIQRFYDGTQEEKDVMAELTAKELRALRGGKTFFGGNQNNVIAQTNKNGDVEFWLAGQQEGKQKKLLATVPIEVLDGEVINRDHNLATENQKINITKVLTRK